MEGKFGLILKRSELGQIVVGDDLVITVVETRRGYCRLGIKCREEVKILRGEHVGASPANPITSIPVEVRQ